MTKSKSNPRSCTCNCCNRQRDQHCGNHNNNNCHVNCTAPEP